VRETEPGPWRAVALVCPSEPSRARASVGSPPRPEEKRAPAIRACQDGTVDSAIAVGIVMGSRSDLETMTPAAVALDELGVESELRVVSAHRTPREMLDYGAQAGARGLRVLIAGAGGAAHLPGMLAAATTLPVIGVPVPLRYLDGLDSLLSIVQMPSGVPVATVAIGAARNAGLLAARILALGDPDLAQRVAAARDEMAATARAMDFPPRQRRPEPGQ
jgi:5-(carboxyamino)imidazole ribonucleotide mutase